jgi:uncharacterized protein (DUF169 family)
MIDLKAVDDRLKQYVKLKEFPVVVKMLKIFSLKEIQAQYPKAKIPHLNLKMKVVTCQAMAMVRKYGWELILTKEDISCPTGLVVLGFVDMIDSMLTGEEEVTPLNQDPKARAKRMQTLTRLPFNQYEALLLAPIHRARFEPDSIVIYGNSAQVMRLVQGAVFKEGGSLSSASAGGQGCAQYLCYPLISKECRYILPGNGDRIFGMTGDDQMIFSMPKEKINQTMEGLEESHMGGQRYPIPTYLLYEAKMPPSYQELTEKLLNKTDRREGEAK